jgi:aerobic-type carbon monoxide dehydrogenase small subunit (CoxS/CutS family)
MRTEENRITVALTVNGDEYRRRIDPDMTLLAFLRDELFLVSVKCGCDDSNCGACTVIVNGRAVKSCCLLAAQADSAQVTTIEGLETDEGLHPLQQAFIDHFAVQCGYCIPGMILTAKTILDDNPNADEDSIREGIHGNICRCTGYKKIVEAVLAARDGGEYRRGEVGSCYSKD